MTALPAALKKQHGLTADISALAAPIEKRENRPKANRIEKSLPQANRIEKSLPLRDALGILFTLQECRCREKDGVLVIEPREKMK